MLHQFSHFVSSGNLEDNIKLAPAGEVKIIVQFGSTLSNKRGRVLSLSLKAISAHDSLTSPPLS